MGRQSEPLGFGLSSGRSPHVAVRMFRRLSPESVWSPTPCCPPHGHPPAPQPHLTPGYCSGLPCPLAARCSLSGTHVSCRRCALSSATPASSQLPTSGPLHGCSMARSSSPDTHGTPLLTSFGILTYVPFSFVDRLSPMSLRPSRTPSAHGVCARSASAVSVDCVCPLLECERGHRGPSPSAHHRACSLAGTG